MEWSTVVIQKTVMNTFIILYLHPHSSLFYISNCTIRFPNYGSPIHKIIQIIIISISVYISFAVWAVCFTDTTSANTWTGFVVVINALACIVHQHHFGRASYAASIVCFICTIGANASFIDLIVDLIYSTSHTLSIHFNRWLYTSAFCLFLIED